MPKKDRPLPSPPGKRFGPGERHPGEASGSLLEEKLAQAAAMGKLDEFMDAEFKDNPHARQLASMMMGMSGMASLTGARPNAMKQGKAAEEESASPPPEDIVHAAKAGDIGELMGLLAREHEKRTGEKPAAGRGHSGKGKSRPQTSESKAGKEEDSTPFDRETLEGLVAIAQENSVSIDWLMARAIRLYIRDYRNTGRL